VVNRRAARQVAVGKPESQRFHWAAAAPAAEWAATRAAPERVVLPARRLAARLEESVVAELAGERLGARLGESVVAEPEG
jgi:hypothetical protein